VLEDAEFRFLRSAISASTGASALAIGSPSSIFFILAARSSGFMAAKLFCCSSVIF
jgi:hypothetical protein